MGGTGALSRLFVYGTLRRGAGAASLLAGARVLGSARYRGRLYDLGAFPGVVPSALAEDVVHGELYALEGEGAEGLLARLDRYEGPEFRRCRVQVWGADEQVREAWIYLYSGDLARRPRIASGDYATRS